MTHAQAAAAEAGWVCYTTENGRRGAVRPEKIHGNPRAGLIKGNQDSAQRLYGYFAKEALERGDACAAEDVRQTPSLPAVLLKKPRDVFSEVNQLGEYRWRDGLTEAVLSKNWTLNDRTPYEYWQVAARGILWNRMREDDRGRWRTVDIESLTMVDRSIERMEMLWDIDVSFSKVSLDVSEICRLCADVVEETGRLTWREVARRYGIPEDQRDHFHAAVMRNYWHEFEDLWQCLGGYVRKRRTGSELLLTKNNVGDSLEPHT